MATGEGGKEKAQSGDEAQWALALGAAGRSPASVGGTLPKRAEAILLERQWDVLQDLQAQPHAMAQRINRWIVDGDDGDVAVATHADWVAQD